MADAIFEESQHLLDAPCCFSVAEATGSSNVAVLNMPSLNGDVHWEHDLQDGAPQL